MFRIIIALVWLALAFPCQAQMTTLGAGGTAKAGLPGPPTFTFQSSTGPSGSGAGPYTASAMAIGSASANRRVYGVYVGISGTNNAITACSIGGVTCDVTYQATPGTGLTAYIISAAVPSGTTANISVTFTSSPGALTSLYLYTTDTTTLSSITPYANNTVSVASGTTVTGTLSGITGGSEVLYGFAAAGISNGTQAISSSTCGMSQDATFGPEASGHANNVPAGSCSVVYGWTTSTSGGAFSMIAIR